MSSTACLGRRRLGLTPRSPLATPATAPVATRAAALAGPGKVSASRADARPPEVPAPSDVALLPLPLPLPPLPLPLLLLLGSAAAWPVWMLALLPASASACSR